MGYNWQQHDWPSFRYDLREIEAALIAFADRAGQITGLLRGLPEEGQTEAIIQLMIAEALKTSEIEGEHLSRQDVLSSIRKQLGINRPAGHIADKASEGAGELMVAVRKNWAEPLDENTLFSWHRMLMKGSTGFAVGQWRAHEASMRVVSGAIHRPEIHFEAPPSARVPREMAAFLKWFNRSEQEMRHAPVRAAVAHLYFESIHPFEDGNGRIGRAISEKALSQGLRRPAILSLSRTIEAGKKAYYDALKRAQSSNEISPWIRYFVAVVLDAQTDAQKQVEFILRRTRFFDRCKDRLNDRQQRVIRRMMEEGPDGFEGGMNARKYMSLTKVSKATATRDLQYLAEQGVFIPIGGGRSTRYRLNL